MRRFLPILVALLSLLVLAVPVGADDWCEADPIVALNDTKVQILIAIPSQYEPYVDGPIDVEIGTPPSVTREVRFTDSGFNGYGETVSFYHYGDDTASGSYTMAIRIHLQLKGIPNYPIPVRVTVNVGGQDSVVHEGTSTLSEFTQLMMK